MVCVRHWSPGLSQPTQALGKEVPVAMQRKYGGSRRETLFVAWLTFGGNLTTGTQQYHTT